MEGLWLLVLSLFVAADFAEVFTILYAIVAADCCDDPAPICFLAWVTFLPGCWLLYGALAPMPSNCSPASKETTLTYMWHSGVWSILVFILGTAMNNYLGLILITLSSMTGQGIIAGIAKVNEQKPAHQPLEEIV